MDDKLNMYDCILLNSLLDNGATNSCEAISINNLAEMSTFESMSKHMIRRSIDKCEKSNFISEGYKDSYSKTFYITKDGITFVKNNFNMGE